MKKPLFGTRISYKKCGLSGETFCADRSDGPSRSNHVLECYHADSRTRDYEIFSSDRHSKSSQRAQTSANAKISTKSDPGFESGFSD